MTTPKREPGRTLRGFTLIEMIVAIGAVALIAVGIAAIFESIGRTVAGGRRVSVLNQYAALIERQMRADFEAMTRDGVLLVRHQYAEQGDPVQTFVDDDQPRPRRIDELLFFARGQFSSARAPLVPGMNAESSEAMIYYGHGIRLDPFADFRATPGYEWPEVDDGAPDPSGRPFRDDLALGNSDDPTNPNRFAADWTLLRKVVLLAPPGGAVQSVPEPADPVWGTLGINRADAFDNEIQVGAQPAASTVFTTLARNFPNDYGFPSTIRGDNRHPMITSGIVDVATTDLAEIKRIVMDVDVYPRDVGGETDLFDPGSPDQSLLNDRYSHSSGGAGSALRYFHVWTEELFPSDPFTGQRIRYEPALPDFYGAMTDPRVNQPYEQAYRLADQRALGASIFIPNCTEFIVEYSFGQIVEDPGSLYHGQLVWFGLDRDIPVDGQSLRVVHPYPLDATTGDVRAYHMPYRKLDGSAGDRKLTPTMLYNTLGAGDTGGGGGNDFPSLLTAHFGYNDPTYSPTDPDVDPATVPWPWPKLIRVTMTLADPTDPSIEQTFQFILETPEGRVF